jgi:hypothetical protein
MINPNVDEVTLVKSSKSKSPKRAKKPNLISSNNNHNNTTTNNAGQQKSQPPPPLPSLSPLLPSNAPIKFTLLNRLSLISKLVENNDDLVLNCVQLVNFFEFYFNDTNSLNQDENTDSSSSASAASNYNSNKSQCHANVGFNRAPLTACYPCIVCSMQFSFDQTFHMHLERKSVVIRVYCIKCDSLKKFYNKCKLLYHVYSHKMTLFEPIYKSIQIESLLSGGEIDFNASGGLRQTFAQSSSSLSSASLSSAQTLLSKERTVNIDLIFANAYQTAMSYNNNNNNNDDELSTGNSIVSICNLFNNGFKISENDLMQAQLFVKRLVLNNFLVYKCHVCDALFFHLKDLKNHYMNSQRLELNSYETTTSTINYINNRTTATNNNNNNNTIQNVNRTYFQMLKQKHATLCQTNSENKKVFKNVYASSSLSGSGSSSSGDGGVNDEDKLKADAFASIINSFSFKRLQFSNRCYTLASSNLLANSNSYFNSPASSLDEVNILICPECGLSFDGKTQANTFRMHLIYECMFSIKYNPPQIKCPSSFCDQLFDTIDETAVHWMASHVLKLHQCDLCEKKGKLSIEILLNKFLGV